MLATRQIVPSTVAHIVCPLSLIGGGVVLLAAVGTSIHVYKPVWRADSDDDIERCYFSATGDEMHLGNTPISMVACAHQCFAVVTQDHRLVVARYQTNLPVDPLSWVAKDPLHHNNAWIVLHRASLSTDFSGRCSQPVHTPQLACSSDGLVVQCAATGGGRYCVSINFPSTSQGAEKLAQTKWVFDVPGSVAQQTFPTAAFKRDVLEQSDEELLERYTIQELVEQKQKQERPEPCIRCGMPPVSVSATSHVCDSNDVSVALLSVASPTTVKSECVEKRDSFAFASADSDCLDLCMVNRPKFDQIFDDKYPMPSCSPYLVLSLHKTLLVLARLGNTHKLTIFSVDEGPVMKICKVVRLAQSAVQPIAGVVHQRRQPFQVLESVDGTGESEVSNTDSDVLWLLLSNGNLTEFPLGSVARATGPVVVQDAPHLLVGDCEGCDWPLAHISGLPSGFRPSAAVPLPHESTVTFEPHNTTRRYIMLSDGVADSHVIDLETRCTVGALLSNGAMTSACGGPSADIIVSYAKGVLQRLSPGIGAVLRVRATFAGSQRMFLLSTAVGNRLQDKEPEHTLLEFYVVITTAINTVLLRGSGSQLEKVNDVQHLILDEPTLAVYCAPDAQELSPPSSHFFAQCTPTRINFSGKWIRLPNVLPEFTSASHACFGDDKWLAVAYGRKFAVFSTANVNDTYVVLLETLPSDVSHVTTWKASESNSGCCNSTLWCVAACLWSHEVWVWMLDCGVRGELRTRYHIFHLDAVALSSFLITKRTAESCDGGVHEVGMGLVLLDQGVVVLQCSIEGPPSLTALKDVDGAPFVADLCLSIATHGAAAAGGPHFDFASLRAGSVELVSLDGMSSSGEQLAVALAPHPGDNSANTDGGMLLPQLHCGLVVYLPAHSFYLLLLADFDGISLRSITELVPPPQPSHLALALGVATNGEAAPPISNPPCDLRRRGVLLRGPVVYQLTHSMRLPSVTSPSHSLTKAVYLHQCNIIVAMLDRGEQASFISTVDVDTFRVVDAMAMKQDEVAMCMEPLMSLGGGEVSGDFIVGTVILSSDAPNAVDKEAATAGRGANTVLGRLIVVQARPLRISTAADIVGPQLKGNGGVVDLSVQSLGDVHLIAVAALDMVLIFRLVGSTLSLMCSTSCTPACTTVALQYPFLSCSLYSWGTRYMRLVSKSSKSNSDKSPNRIHCPEPVAALGDVILTQCLQDDLSLRHCALEPTPFANIHSQTTFADGFVRVDGNRNVVILSLKNPKVNGQNSTAVAAGIVGADGGLRSSITRCMRLPSCIQRVSVQRERSHHHLHPNGKNNNNNNIHDNGGSRGSFRPSELTPWRYRQVPFVCWHGRPTALRVVGPSLLLPCADGALHCAREIPQAFVGVLLRLEQRATELYDTTFSLSRRGSHVALGESPSCGLQRTYHTVSYEAETALQSPTRVLMKQSFVSVDAVGELVLLRRLVEIPDAALTSEERLLVERKASLLDERLEHVWAEYGGELKDMAVAELLYLW